MIGHNSEAEIVRCINDSVEKLLKSDEKFEKLQEQLDTSKDEEQEPILLEIGRQLLEGRKPFENSHNPRAFGDWISHNFPNLQLILGSRNELAAVIWAAEKPDDYWDIKGRHPRTRTIRGRHTKWKEEEAKRKAEEGDDDKPDDEDDDVVDNKNTPKDDKPKGSNPTTGSTSSGSGSSSSSGGGKGSLGINTNNPDTSKAKADIGLIASSFIGVKTNIELYMVTNDLGVVDERDLANAILSEIIQNSASVMTDDDISEYIDTLRGVLDVLSKSLPVLEGPKSNVVNFTNLKETYQ